MYRGFACSVKWGMERWKWTTRTRVFHSQAQVYPSSTAGFTFYLLLTWPIDGTQPSFLPMLFSLLSLLSQILYFPGLNMRQDRELRSKRGKKLCQKANNRFVSSTNISLHFSSTKLNATHDLEIFSFSAPFSQSSQFPSHMEYYATVNGFFRKTEKRGKKRNVGCLQFDKCDSLSHTNGHIFFWETHT